MQFKLLTVLFSVLLLGCTQAPLVSDDESLLFKGDICNVITVDDVGRICGGDYDSSQSIWAYENKQVLAGCNYFLRGDFNSPIHGYVSINQYNMSSLNDTLEIYNETYRANYSFPPFDSVKVVQKTLLNYTFVMANYSYKIIYNDIVSNQSINEVNVFLYPRFASEGDLRHFDIQNEGTESQPPCNEREIEQLAELLVQRIG